MIQPQELYRQILCRYSNEISKEVTTKKYGIKTCKASLTEFQIEELSYAKDLLEAISFQDFSFPGCDINKLLQNINYL